MKALGVLAIGGLASMIAWLMPEESPEEKCKRQIGHLTSILNFELSKKGEDGSDDLVDYDRCAKLRDQIAALQKGLGPQPRVYPDENGST